MATHEKPSGSKRVRYRCLVVAFDQAERSFLADVWFNFRPGFEVYTASDGDSAILWLRSVAPDIIAITSSVDVETFRKLLNAIEKSDSGISCVIVGARGDMAACFSDTSLTTPVVEFQNALDLRGVLLAAREAAGALEAGPVVGDAPVAVNDY